LNLLFISFALFPNALRVVFVLSGSVVVRSWCRLWIGFVDNLHIDGVFVGDEFESDIFDTAMMPLRLTDAK